MAVRKRIYETKRKREVIWGYQFQRDQRTYLESGFTSYKEAAAAEEAKKRELTFDERHVVEVHQATLQEFFPLYIQHRRATRAAGTVNHEERFGRQLVKVLGKRLMSDITTADIYRYVAQRKTDDGLANTSVNRELNVLRTLFRFALDCGYVQDNPVTRVKALREIRTDRWIPSPEELKRFADEAGKTYSGKVLAVWIWFMAFTGTRPSEALFVEWIDIDFDRGQITIRPKNGNLLKSGKVRHIELHGELKVILLTWREEWNRVFAERAERYPNEPTSPHDWIFYNPRKQLARADSFKTCFRAVRKKTQLPNITPYTLRHFFISYCVMNGIDFLTISRWVGHSSTHMIERVYGHLTAKYRAEQMNKFTITPGPATINIPVV
jgi:integrase